MGTLLSEVARPVLKWVDAFDLTWRASWPGSLLWDFKAKDDSESHRNEKKRIKVDFN